VRDNNESALIIDCVGMHYLTQRLAYDKRFNSKELGWDPSKEV